MSNYTILDVLLGLALTIILVRQLQIFLRSRTQPLWHFLNAALTVSAASALVFEMKWATLFALSALVMEGARSAFAIKHLTQKRPKA